MAAWRGSETVAQRVGEKAGLEKEACSLDEKATMPFDRRSLDKHRL